MVKVVSRLNHSHCMTPAPVSTSKMRQKTTMWLIFLAFFSYSEVAAAHVKWFAPYDLLCPPRPLFSIFTSPYFLPFCVVMIGIMFATTYIDVLFTHRAQALNRIIAQGTSWFQPKVFLIMRLGVFAFFVSVAVYGNVFLTPELKTDWPWVRWMQLVMAVLVLHPRTAFVTGLGICVLYACAAFQYGWFHLLDYPIFLGVAYYLFTMSRSGEAKAMQALTVLRVLTGVTLLWGGMEKFAYPDWSFPLLIQRPNLAFGFNPEFFMISAGFVEFTAAFLVITVAIAARASSALLLFIFTSAIPEFGVVDAVGHAVIIIVLVVLIFSHNPIAERLETGRSAFAASVLGVGLYFAALALEAGFFYFTHWLAYGT